METISRQEISDALERLGQLAAAQSDKVELVLVGDALMVRVYGTVRARRPVM